MTMVIAAPLKLRRELCDGVPDEVDWAMDGRGWIQCLVQLQTERVVAGESCREEVCFTVPSKLDVAGRDGNPCTRDLRRPIMTPT